VEKEVVQSSAGLSLRPVLNCEPFETEEVFLVCGHDDEPIDVGNRGNLAINEGRRVPKGFKSGSLLAVPRRSRLVVGQDRKGSMHNIT